MNFDKLSVWDWREPLSPFMFHSVQAPVFLMNMLTFERPSQSSEMQSLWREQRELQGCSCHSQWAHKTLPLATCFCPLALLIQTISLSWGKCISLFFPSGLMFHLSLVSASQQCLLNDGFSRKLGLAVSSSTVLYIKGGNSSPEKKWITSVQMQVDRQDTEVNLPYRFLSSVGTIRKGSHNPVNKTVTIRLQKLPSTSTTGSQNHKLFLITARIILF